MDKTKLVDAVANCFAELCKEKLCERMESLYITGSYVFNKISLDRPDINFLLIFKGRTMPDDYLKQGEICREIIEQFKNECSVRIEFRPFRYLYPKVRKDFDIFLNPILISVDEIKDMGCIFTKLFTEGLQSANKLIYGKDILNDIKIGEITKQDVLKGAMFDLPFFTIPLTRAPAQYDDSETDLLLNEALINGKMLSYLGIEIALTEKELNNKVFMKYIQNKETITDFYKERYGERIASQIEIIYDARENYSKFKNDPIKAREVFSATLQIGGVIQFKLFSG